MVILDHLGLGLLNFQDVHKNVKINIFENKYDSEFNYYHSVKPFHKFHSKI